MYRDRLDILGLGSTDTLDRVCIPSGSKLVLLPPIYLEALFCAICSDGESPAVSGVSIFVCCLLLSSTK